MNDQQFSDAELAGLPWLMRATAENGWLGLLALLAIIVLAILVFNLGFARKLPPLKKGSHIRALNRWRLRAVAHGICLWCTDDRHSDHFSTCPWYLPLQASFASQGKTRKCLNK